MKSNIDILISKHSCFPLIWTHFCIKIVKTNKNDWCCAYVKNCIKNLKPWWIKWVNLYLCISISMNHNHHCKKYNSIHKNATLWSTGDLYSMSTTIGQKVTFCQSTNTKLKIDINHVNLGVVYNKRSHKITTHF